MRENEITSYLFYKLLSYPTSLFKNGITRDPKKSKLRQQNKNQTELPGAVVHVIDGGVVIHLVQWLSNTTYSGVIKQYREYLLAAFVPCTVILYGYDNGPSTKYTKLSQVIAVDLNKKVNTWQEKFIKNVKNKPMLISFLRDNLRKYGFNIFEVPGNVKTLIAKVA